MPRKSSVKLGLNIDHVATLRQARGGDEPDVLQAAVEGIDGGADGITVHLREDRRHVQPRDVLDLKKRISVPLNLEMSVAEEIVNLACRFRPAKACLVPERRQELTTEGGLDVAGAKRRVAEVVDRLQSKGILVSLFIDPIPNQIQAAFDVDCDFIELHTGRYANTQGKRRQFELRRLREAAVLAHELGLGVNAGHGLNYNNVKPIAKLPHVHELNIGHSIVAHSVSSGLYDAVKQMRALIRNGR
jgi:pyridoxine 5-phosphate synthase